MSGALTSNSGDIYEQAVVKTVAGFFRGNPTHLFGVTRFGAPVVYVRAGSIHLNEVAMPQSPGAESGQVIPQIVASASCLPMSRLPFFSEPLFLSRRWARLRLRSDRKAEPDLISILTPPHATAGR